MGESEFSNRASAALSGPATTDTYSGLWHNSDFLILLNASDSSGVSETYYRINDGAVRSVSLDGQPQITLENTENFIEYWSVDCLGNEEVPHKMRTQIKLDKTAPTCSLQIDDGSMYVPSNHVTLSLKTADTISGVHQVRFSNDGALDTEEWQPLSPTKTWVLASGDGERTICCQVQDTSGLVSDSCSANVIVDTLAPQGSIVIDLGAAYTNTSTVNLALSANDAGSGVAQMRFSNDQIAWSVWEDFSTSKLWSLQKGDGEKTVIVQYRDKAGRVSTSTCSITLDTTSPLADIGEDKTVHSGSPVSFDAKNCTDETDPVSFLWNFGDGTTGHGQKTNHTYKNPGRYLAALTVQDEAGNKVTSTALILVQAPESPFMFYEAITGAVSVVAITAALLLIRRRSGGP